jgi:transposase
MNTNKMNRRFTQHEAFSLIEEYFQSGQRATDFYRSKNMSEWQFYKWRKLYLEVHPEHEASKTPPAKEPSLLQPVTVIGKPSSRRMPRFEIAYPGGVTLRVDEGGNRHHATRGTAHFLISRTMFSLNESQRFYLCLSPTDLRKGFDSLCGLVSSELGRDPLGGEVFIFVNRSRTTIKLLHWERGGLVLYHKRLESGRFSLPRVHSSGKGCSILWRDLVMMVEGISMEKTTRRKRFNIAPKTA